ncbi:MAG: tRNA pseudouridine(38-40) synthase TruA [Pseudomonadota bacterium]|nr:tRNA pseudouridine(38-40) synthase TruA [Pseudomonadota bacterium]
MTRWRLELEYDGAGFVGWQRQDNGLSVQEVVESGIQGFTGESVRATAAGRTDSGVHALSMTVHVDFAKPMEPERVMQALNAHMRPHPVAALAARPVPDDFHARFSCLGRHYRYRILVRRAGPVLERGRVWHVPQGLDVDAMNRAAAVLVGRHDFESFRSTQCQADTAVKTLDRLHAVPTGEEVVVSVSARSFLHNQVRILTGTLVQVGLGRWTVGDVQAALEARDRAAAGPTAPPDGLYFVRADYPRGTGPDPSP